MKYILIASLLLGGCTHLKEKYPERYTNERITQEDLYSSEDHEKKRADDLGLRLVDYLHLVNTNKIKR